MDTTAAIDAMTAALCIGGAIYALFALLLLGLGRMAALSDEELERYAREELGTVQPFDSDIFDQEARDWIERGRAAS